MAKVFRADIDVREIDRMLSRAEGWLVTRLDPFTQDAFGEIMRDAADLRFASESNRGQSWDPLKPVTVRRRIAAGFPGQHPINVRTEGMFRFLHSSDATGGPTGEGVEYSWPEPAGGELYMKMLRAYGFDRRTPARPVIDADDTHMDQFIEDAYDDFEAWVT